VSGPPIQRIRLAEELPEPLSHYTDAVRAGNTLWLSGQLAVDRHGTLIGEGDVTAQTEQVFHNIGLVLAYAGASFGDVAKLVLYVVNIGDREAINAVRRRHFGDARPASTLVEVSALAIPGALVEVDAVVHVPR
jgi:2-iminobutanoate/2-iminopropanoate deaminase